MHRQTVQRLAGCVADQRGGGGRRVGGRVGEAVSGVGEGRESLIEADVDQAAVLERRRGLDLGHDVLEEEVSRVQATGVVDRRVRRVRVGEAARQVVAVADGVMAVAAVVGRDPAEGRCRRLALQVVVEAVARIEQAGDVRRVAVARLEDRLEPREREVLRDVLVGRVRATGVRVGCATGRTGRAVGRAAILNAGVVGLSSAGARERAGRGRIGIAQILRIALPAHVCGIELVKERRHARRIDATVGARCRIRPRARDELPVVRVGRERAGRVDAAGHRVVIRTVRLVVRLGRLAADLRDVVVEAEVSGAVVVGQQRALGRQRLPQVGVVVQAREACVIGLVLEDDQPDVLDLAGLDAEAVAGRARRCADRHRRNERGRREQDEAGYPAPRARPARECETRFHRFFDTSTWSQRLRPRVSVAQRSRK